MNSTAIVITTAIALPVTALAAWIWITVARINRDLRNGLEGIHFEV